MLKSKKEFQSLGKTRKVYQSFYWMMCGLRGPKRNWPKNGLHVNSKSWISPEDSAKPEDRSKGMGIWCPMKNHNGGKGCEGKFLERDTSYLRIECPTPIILAALIWKWHLKSNFIACSPFYHLQQSFDGTSILRDALRHTGGEIGCKEEGYKRKRASQKQRGDFYFL